MTALIRTIRRARVIARYALPLVLVASSACSKPAPSPKRPVPVTVGVAARGPVPYLIAANGQVEPINSVSIQPQVGGVLTEVTFREGADVVAGQLLFRIDPRQYEAAFRQAQAVVARDQASAENSRRDAERYATLAQKDYVTKSQADEAAAGAAALKSAVDADQAALENARLNLEYATIRAPISGRTGSLVVRAGNVVRPGGGDLVTINQIHPIRIRFAVPQRDLAEVQRYQKAGKVRVLARPGSDSVPEVGMLTFVENTVDTVTGTVTLKGEFPNASNRLWPGQFIAVQLELYVEPNALTVPSQAVIVGQDGSYVFLIQPGDSVHMQPVVTGRSIDNKTIIVKGLDAGARVVTDGQSRLEPGSKIEIRPGVQ